MKKGSTYFFICILGLFFTNCKSECTPSKYIKYCKNVKNGLVQQIVKNGFIYTVRYLPSELCALRDIKNNASNETFQTQLDNYRDHVYIVMDIQSEHQIDFKEALKAKVGKENVESAFQKIQFELQPALSIKEGNVTTPCALYHADHIPVGLPAIRLTMVFPYVLKKENDLIFYFEDTVTGSEKLEFLFEKNDINRIPELHI